MPVNGTGLPSADLTEYVYHRVLKRKVNKEQLLRDPLSSPLRRLANILLSMNYPRDDEQTSADRLRVPSSYHTVAD